VDDRYISRVPASSVFSGTDTIAIGELVTVVDWYDNE